MLRIKSKQIKIILWILERKLSVFKFQPKVKGSEVIIVSFNPQKSKITISKEEKVVLIFDKYRTVSEKMPIQSQHSSLMLMLKC